MSKIHKRHVFSQTGFPNIKLNTLVFGFCERKQVIKFQAVYFPNSLKGEKASITLVHMYTRWEHNAEKHIMKEGKEDLRCQKSQDPLTEELRGN